MSAPSTSPARWTLCTANAWTLVDIFANVTSTVDVWIAAPVGAIPIPQAATVEFDRYSDIPPNYYTSSIVAVASLPWPNGRLTGLPPALVGSYWARPVAPLMIGFVRPL